MKEKELVQVIPELIGVSIEITQASHKPYVGLKGKVMDETKNTFLIEVHGLKLIRVPKKNIKFKFTTEEGKSVVIDGNMLLHSPENRLKKVK
ncbi:MAG: ribonuclease P protein subunit [Candidatus Thermoplasmatota archaeon]